MNGKKILTVQDLSCVGQCSISVALPVLSYFGMETAVLPTALLSNHTQYKKWSYLDLTDQAEEIFASWKQNAVKFNGFLVGYLGNTKCMDICKKAFKSFSGRGAKVIVDPAFADNGKLYAGFDEGYVEAMKKFIKSADFVLPNMTEACLMTGMSMPQRYGRGFAENLMRRMTEFTDATIILTGIQLGTKIGAGILYRTGKEAGTIEFVMLPKIAKSYHGTGDIFSAAFAANRFNGKSVADSCRIAGEFVAKSITATDEAHIYGVQFEDVMLASHEK